MFQNATKKIIINQQDYFSHMYKGLTARQQKVLKAISIENENIFSSVYIQKYRLGSSSSVQRSTERLIKEGILEKGKEYWHFTDPFFKIWLFSL